MEFLLRLLALYKVVVRTHINFYLSLEKVELTARLGGGGALVGGRGCIGATCVAPRVFPEKEKP